MGLVDPHGRKINYLRLSVTDRCNLRCSYCMPPEGVEKVCHSAVLSYEDLLRITEAAVSLGIEKVRVTGGEPLVRKGIVPFLERLAALPGLRELVLTTNGLLLPEMAGELRRAGVQRLNVSLDSLRPETFARITGGGELRRVLDGLDAAEAAGFPPAKLNMVVMRGVNDDEILDFVELTARRPLTVRFIEYMPSLKSPGWESLAVPGDEILRRVRERFELEPAEKSAADGPSRDFRIRAGAGRIGIITAVSGHFCSACNRIRVTAEGKARSCLFADDEIDLKPFLQGDDESLREALAGIVAAKPERHRMAEKEGHSPFTMSKIGG